LDAVAERGAAPGEQFIVAYRLAGMVNETTREAWPSLDKLALRSGVSRRTAQRAIRSLKDAGAVESSSRGEGRTWVKPVAWWPSGSSDT
jgi:DNA-binding transcriptional regulator YhcF (GntR family)